MNKTELLKRIEDMGEYEAFVDEPISKSAVRHLINQLDEPQKVVIPKSMAEWIEEYKQSNNSLIEAINLLYESYFPEDCEWLTNNSETFARAWMDGYEVEQEKLYTVEIPNPKINKGPIAAIALVKNHSNEVQISVFIGDEDWKEDARSHLTESEIRKDFEWAWREGFAKEV